MRKHPVLFGLLIVFVILAGFVGISTFLSHPGGKKAFVGGEDIGVVEIEGAIVDADAVIDQLIRYRENTGMKAIVLRINSPGGAVGPSQEIYQEVMKTRKQKKVVASLGSVAASGGYYIACGSDAIVANPGTITGSIGVIMQFSNLEGLMKYIGMKTYTYKSGEYKDIGSPFRDPTPADQEILMGVIRNVYEQFVEAVAKGRRMDVNRVKELADGRILSGQQAMEKGLVDQMGNLQDAIDLAAKLSNIKGKPNVIYPKRKWSLFRLLFEEGMSKWIEELGIRSHQLYYQIPLPSWH
jgi:protease-4